MGPILLLLAALLWGSAFVAQKLAAEHLGPFAVTCARNVIGGAFIYLCFRLRLGRTAEKAKAEGFDLFATTLTVSPHKNAQVINAIGAELGQRLGVSWLYSDFKKREGYKRSLELCRELGIYRQNYCGCRLISAEEGGASL